MSEHFFLSRLFFLGVGVGVLFDDVPLPVIGSNHAVLCDGLLDYLAVCRDARGQGYGTRALELVKGQYGPVPLLAEVEAPEESAPPGENALRQRRLHFYRRAGFAPLGYQAVLFGVRYAMLAWPAADSREGERLQAAHRALYQSEVPPLLFRRVIHIPTEKPTPARKD